MTAAGYAAIVVVGIAVAIIAGFLLAALPSVRRIKLFAALITGVLVWFLVRTIPESVSTLGAGLLRVVAPHLAGPLQAKQMEVTAAVAVAEFIGAALVLLAYAIGMKQARAPLAQQRSQVVGLRIGALIAGSLGWALWVPRIMTHPPASTGIGLALSVVALGAAIAVLAQRGHLEPQRSNQLIASCAAIAVLGALLGQLQLPELLIVAAAAMSTLCLVYIVGQLVELTTLDLRVSGHGGMLPATIVGFVVGLAIGR